MVEKGFELKFVGRFVGIILTGVGAVILLLYIIIPKSEARHYADVIRSFIEADDTISGAIIIALLVESIIISAMVILTAVFASHKIAGPIYRLKNVLAGLVNTGVAEPLRFRNYDQAQDTASSFNTMIKGLNDHFSAISDAYEEFEKTLKALNGTPESVERLKEKVDCLGNALGKFRF